MNIQDFAGIDRLENDLPNDFSTVMDERSHDNVFLFMNSMLSYYALTCISVADRAFLNEIYSVSWNEACVIHGSSYKKTNSLNRIFKFPGNRTSEKMRNKKSKKNSMSTDLNYCFHKSYDKKIQYALKWLNNLPEKNPIAMVTAFKPNVAGPSTTRG